MRLLLKGVGGVSLNGLGFHVAWHHLQGYGVRLQVGLVVSLGLGLVYQFQEKLVSKCKQSTF